MTANGRVRQRLGMFRLAWPVLAVLAAAACGQSEPAPAPEPPAPAAPPGPRLYVSDETGGNVVVIDPTAGTVIETIPVGKRPRGIVLSRDRKFCSWRCRVPHCRPRRGRVDAATGRSRGRWYRRARSLDPQDRSHVEERAGPRDVRRLARRQHNLRFERRDSRDECGRRRLRRGSWAESASAESRKASP